MKITMLKVQVFKIPAMFIGIFILNIFLMTWSLSVRQSYSDYPLVILAGCFFIIPALFGFYLFYQLLKKLQEDKKSYWRFIIKNTKKSLLFYLAFSLVGHAVVENLSGGVVLTGAITAVGIWLSTGMFIMLNRILFKPYVRRLNGGVYITRNNNNIINPISDFSMMETSYALAGGVVRISESGTSSTIDDINYINDNLLDPIMMEINPASGAPMIGGFGGTDVFGNSYGMDYCHNEHLQNDNYDHFNHDVYDHSTHDISSHYNHDDHSYDK